MDPKSDIEHVREVLSGNAEAFRPIVDRYKGMVLNIVHRLVRNRMEAEEIAQDVFMNAFKALPTFKAEARFSTWLYRIAHNKAVSHQRKRSSSKGIHTSQSPEELQLEHEEELFDKADDLQALREQHLPDALASLDPEDEALIGLYYQQDLSIAEVSEITGLTQANVKVRLHRARKQLYTFISDKLYANNARYE